MSYNILVIRHSGQGVIGSTSTTTQYGSPMVAATANPGSRFVRFSPASRCFAPPGLPLSAASAKPFGVATGARTQNRIHGQPPGKTDSGGASSLPPGAAAHQSRSGSSVRAMAGTKLCPWLRPIPTVSSNAFFNTVRIVAPRPSWPRFTKCWHRAAGPIHQN